jgi:hypothetical protein
MPPRKDVAPPNELNPIAVNPIDKPEATGIPVLSGVADSYRMGWMGQVSARPSNEARPGSRRRPTSTKAAHSQRLRELRALFRRRHHAGRDRTRRAQIDTNIAARKRRDARGGWSTFGTDLLAGVADPINLIAPELKGLGFVGGALKGAATIGLAGAAAEGVRGTLDPTASRAETVASMLSSDRARRRPRRRRRRGHGLAPSAAPSAAATRSVRPVIDVKNADASGCDLRSRRRPQGVVGGKNLVGTPTFDGKKVVQAMGAAQVTGDTGKAMAKKLGDAVGARAA